MKKKLKKIAMVITLFSGFTVFAQEGSEVSKPSVDISLAISTNYIWRGYDLYVAKFDAKSKEHGALNIGPSFQPSLTFYTPVEGLSFNMWMAYALSARDDKDGALRALDEVDYTVSYEFENKVGSWSSAYVIYTYPTTVAGSLVNNYSELVFGYGAALPLSPSLSTAVTTDNGGGSTAYYSAGISHAIESGALSIEPSLSLNYWYYNDDGAQNWAHADVSLPIGFGINDSLSVGLTATGSYRMLYGLTKIAKSYTVAGSNTVKDQPALITNFVFNVDYSL